MTRTRGIVVSALCLIQLLGVAATVRAQAPLRKIGELDLSMLGLSASVDRAKLTVPKNLTTGVPIAVRAGSTLLASGALVRLLGGSYAIEGELSGPGLGETLTLRQAGPTDALSTQPLLLPVPPLAIAGSYTLSNLRLVVGNRPVLDVTPRLVPLDVIDQVLVTSVKTRPLTLQEIKDKGIVLDKDDYLAFEFTLGLKLESRAVNITFPVVFDRQGVPVPEYAVPPMPMPAQDEDVPAFPQIVPVMLRPPKPIMVKIGGDREEEVKIPSVLVIPGNVGYLKQFFSAQLFVANGAPAGSALTVASVTGTMRLPEGADHVLGTPDDPLSPAETVKGVQPTTMPVRREGAGGDIERFAPGEQGMAEFLIRGDQEGFHSLGFDIKASLEGLPTGLVTVSGRATGGVLVRNPYFDMTFTVPAIVRKGERFKVYASVTNIGQGLANDVSVTIDSSRLSGARIVGDATKSVDTLLAGDSKMLKFEFDSDVTGQVVASYLHLETQNGSTGHLKFTLGVGERGIVLSPDTLVLPTQASELPEPVVDAAMRVLGQAWSIANAAPGTIPKGVVRVDRALVKQKALALAEGGLRVTLGEPLAEALQNLLPDFAGGSPIDAGFDQLLRETAAGHAFLVALGHELAPAATTDPLGFERSFSEATASGPDFMALTIASGPTAAPVDVSIVDAAGRRTNASTSIDEIPVSQVRGASLVPMGAPATAPLFGMIAAPAASPYTIDLVGRNSGSVDLSITVPRADGTFSRAHAVGVPVVAGGRSRIVVDLLQSTPLVLEEDADGDGSFETQLPLAIETLSARSPQLLSATVIGPETLPAAGPFGVNVALLFDRIVDPVSASSLPNYSMPRNRLRSARRQLSGRLVFASLDQPEGPYVPASISVNGVADGRGTPGGSATKTLGSRLQGPGAVVSGRILNPDGTPVVGATVTYQNNPNWKTCETPDLAQSGFAAVNADASGRFEFRYVRQDQCGFPWAMVTQDDSTGSIRTASGFVRTAGEHIVLDMVLFGKGTLTGVVRDLSGAAVPDALVVALSDTDPNIGGQARTDGDGRYTIFNLLVGAITVKAVHGMTIGSGATRIARAGTTAALDVTLNSGSVHVTGIVQRLEGELTSPAAGVFVSYKLVDPAFPAGNRRVALTTTKVDGSYEFELVPAGSYLIDAQLDTGDRASVSGVAAAGDDLHRNLVIEIARNARVSGIVRFPDGTSAGNVVVTVSSRGVLSGADGTFDVRDVPVMPNVAQPVVARTQDARRTGRSSVIINQSGQHVSDVVVTLSGLGTAEFLVLDPAGHPMVGQDVLLLYTGESLLTPSCVLGCGCALAVQRTDAQGRVRFADIPPGPAKARAMRITTQMADVVEAIALVPRDGETGTAVLRFGGTGTVAGIVFDPDGQPAFGADVELNSVHFNLETCSLTSGVSHRARTDTNGRFKFSGVNVGPVTVNASQTFFPTRVPDHGTLFSNGQQLDFTLRLVNSISGELSGTVFLPDGLTPAGAGVEVTANGPLPDVTVTTDDAGHYRFAKIFPEGRYSLTVSDPITGGVGYESIFIKAAQDAVHDLRLKGRGTVKVHVVDGGGADVSSAFVHLQESSFPSRAYDGAVEEANGRVVTFPSVFEGPFSVQATDALGRGGRISAVLAGAEATLDVTVRLTVTGTVRGRFLMPDRTTPIPFASVRLIAGGRTIGQSVTRGGADAGLYEFTFVPAGDVRVEADDPITARNGIGVGRIESEGDELPLDIVATGIGTIEGFVTSNGAPRSGAHVDVTSGSFKAGTFTGPNGRYIVVGVPEGRIVATASLPGGALTGTASATLAGDGTTLTLDVPLRDSGVVTGHVFEVDGVTPAPASAVSIQVGGVGGGIEQTTTEADGSFRFDRVAAGHATIAVDVLGSIDQGASTVDVVGNTTTDAPVTLNGVGSLRGVARDSANNPDNPIDGDLTIAGTGAFRYAFTVRTAADGSYSVPQLLAGPVTLSLRARVGALTLYGSASGTIAASMAGTATPSVIDVRLQDAGSVTGLVLRADGTTPAVGAGVTLTLDQGRGVVQAQALADGRFTVTGVPLGGFIATVSDPITTGVGRSPHRSVDANLQIVELVPIVLDDTPVEIVSVDPPDGASGVLPTRAIRVVFSDAISSTSGLSITTAAGVNVSSPTSLSSDGLTVTFTGTLPELADLTISMTTALSDSFGRHPAQAFTSHFRTSDVSPPAVSAIVPANGATQIGPSAVVQVAFTEPIVGDNLASVVTVRTGSAVVPGTTTLTSPTSAVFTPAAPLVINASYAVTVNGAIDASGNQQTSPFNSSFKTLDTIPPALSLASPPADGWTTSKRPTIQVSATDALTGIKTTGLSLTLDPGTANAATVASLVLVPAFDLAEGPHSLTASASDNAGNTTTLNASFSVDSVAPTSALITGVTDLQVVRDTITVGATADDTTSGISRIDLYRDGFLAATFTAPQFQASLNTHNYTEGSHTFTARATDRAGNVGPSGPEVRLVVDNVLLTLSLTAPPSGGRFVTSVVASATPSEPVDRVEFSVGPVTNPNLITVTDDTSPYSVTLPLTAVPEGTAIVTARAFGMGDPASASRNIVVDRTPPPAPDPSRINAEPPTAGASQVSGEAGAVEPGSTIEVTNLANNVTVTGLATATGTFTLNIPGSVDDVLALVSIDTVANRSATTFIAIRATPSIPPFDGATDLRFEGILADRVSPAGGAAGLVADGALDAVFTLDVAVGDAVTRQLSYIDLAGPQTRSTRSGAALGVAADAGSPLLNNADGTVSFPITTHATLTLVAADGGFIVDGATYTVTLGFTDGSRFVGSFTIVAPADRNLVAHSATMTANPATVTVPAGGAGTTTLTLTNIRDINSTRVPDGAKIALAVADMAAKDPRGNALRSAGGQIVGGTVAANNAAFRVFTIQGGSVTATYSSAPITPAAVNGASALVQMMAADAAGNVLGTEAIATLDLNVRAATDQVIVMPATGAVYADGSDRRVAFAALVRDAAGNPVPDGTKVAVTAVNCVYSTAGTCNATGTASLFGGAVSASSGYRAYTVSGGRIDGEYSSLNFLVAPAQLGLATLKVVPASSNGTITSSTPIGTATISATGPGASEAVTSADSVPFVWPARSVQVVFHHVHDMRGNLVPDGARFLVSANSCATRDVNSFCINSAGGSILDGTSSNSSGFKVFTLTLGQLSATYATDGGGTGTVSGIVVGQDVLSNVQLAMSNTSGTLQSFTNIAIAPIRVTSPSNAVGTAQPSTLIADNGVHTSTVTFFPVLDSFGNPLPDGSRVLASAQNCAGRDRTPQANCIASDGGQILDGEPSASSGYKAFTVQNGTVTLTYSDQNITAVPGQIKTANIVLMSSSNSVGSGVSSFTALGFVSVRLAGTTSAQTSANPPTLYADGADRRSFITVSNIRDAAGQVVPDGTKLVVSAATCIVRDALGNCVSSAGGTFIGAPTNSQSLYIGTVQNGQVVFEYSSLNIASFNGNERTAVIGILGATSSGNFIGGSPIAVVNLRLLPAKTAGLITATPADLFGGDGQQHLSQIVITGLVQSDGVTPIPDGAKVNISAAGNLASGPDGSVITSVGGAILSSGTTPGDGTFVPSNSGYTFTVAGGEVRAGYSSANFFYQVNQTANARVFVRPASIDGGILGNALAVATIKLRGATSATATGPTSLSRTGSSGPTSGTVTFSGIRDSAGNILPDGSTVAVGAIGTCAVRDPQNGACAASVGGTIAGGTTVGGSYKMFTVQNGSINITYSTAGVAGTGIANVYITPVRSDGVMGSTWLIGGIVPITITP